MTVRPNAKPEAADHDVTSPLDIVRIPLRWTSAERREVPRHQTPWSAGVDLMAAIDEPLSVPSLSRVLVPTGISIALPPGYEGQVRPRSGLAWSRGLTILNAPGTIDADYRGEIKVLLVNLSAETAVISPGERIAQLVVARHAHVEFEVVESLDDTARGGGGYGSTGY